MAVAGRARYTAWIMGETKAQASGVKPFLERLRDGVVVCDGAMGTMLYSRGVFVTRCFDELTLSNPGLVQGIHQEYVESGADVVETNTFGAHRFKLGPHGFDGQVVKINREGARIARAAALGQALVAGSIGPLGKPLEPFGNIAFDDAVAAYREQAQGLVEGGVALFLLETMPSLDQARAAVTAVQTLSELPIVVSLTFNEEGTTAYGEQPEDVVRAAEQWDVAVVGANCSQGPQQMLEKAKPMAAAPSRGEPSAEPNPGPAGPIDGRSLHPCPTADIADFAPRRLA